MFGSGFVGEVLLLKVCADAVEVCEFRGAIVVLLEYANLQGYVRGDLPNAGNKLFLSGRKIPLTHNDESIFRHSMVIEVVPRTNRLALALT